MAKQVDCHNVVSSICLKAILVKIHKATLHEQYKIVYEIIL